MGNNRQIPAIREIKNLCDEYWLDGSSVIEWLRFTW